MARKKAPTDLDILNFIYDHYYDDFCTYDLNQKIRANKIYVPIDCQMIADQFGIDGDIIFGRLYYHLSNKYKYQLEKNVTVKIFEFKIDSDMHCVHFPYLASIVSDLNLQDRRFKLTLWASIFAVVISLLSISISSYEKFVTKPEAPKVTVELKYHNSIQPIAEVSAN